MERDPWERRASRLLAVLFMAGLTLAAFAAAFALVVATWRALL